MLTNYLHAAMGQAHRRNVYSAVLFNAVNAVEAGVRFWTGQGPLRLYFAVEYLLRDIGGVLNNVRNPLVVVLHGESAMV